MYTALLASSDTSLRSLSSSCLSSLIRPDSNSTIGYTFHPLDTQFCIAMPFFRRTMQDPTAKGLYALTLSVLLPYSLRISYLSLGTDLYSIGSSALSLLALMTSGIALGLGPMACLYTCFALLPACTSCGSRGVKPLMITPHGLLLTHLLLTLLGTLILLTPPSSTIWDRATILLQYLPLLYLPVLGGRAAATPWVSKAFDEGKATKGQPIPAQASALGLKSRLPWIANAIAGVAALCHAVGVGTLTRAVSVGGGKGEAAAAPAVRWFWGSDYAGTVLALALLMVVEKGSVRTVGEEGGKGWLSLLGYAVVLGPGAAALLV